MKNGFELYIIELREVKLALKSFILVFSSFSDELILESVIVGLILRDHKIHVPSFL